MRPNRTAQPSVPSQDAEAAARVVSEVFDLTFTGQPEAAIERADRKSVV